MSVFRPLLGAKISDLSELRYPLWASYKIDGIRAIWWGSEFMSRSMKTIPNRLLQKWALQHLQGFPRWDGELVCGEPCGAGVFNRTTRCVMSQHADPAAMRFFVFDNVDAPGGFLDRNATLRDMPPFVRRLGQVMVKNIDEVLEVEDDAINRGYEGLILRHPKGPYKQGRSTFREHTMLKLKRFTDDEAVVVDFEELMHNANELTLSETGYSKRSSHHAGKLPSGVLGALVCNWQGRTLRVGTGFTAAERARVWKNRDNFIGRSVKFKYLSIGVVDLPRHPVFLGWRHEADL